MKKQFLKKTALYAILPCALISIGLAYSFLSLNQFLLFLFVGFFVIYSIVVWAHYMSDPINNNDNDTFYKRTLILIPLVYCIVFTFGFMVIGDSLKIASHSHDSTNYESHSSANYSETGEYFIKTDCTGAYTKDDFDIMDRAIRHNNKSDYDRLLQSSSLKKLYAGDRIYIIDNGAYCAKIKTSDGIVLYVHRDFITTSNPVKHYEYHNKTTGEGQNSYGGSKEQQRDLDMIDEYARTHPDF